MVAIDASCSTNNDKTTSSLRTITAAALALPGLMIAPSNQAAADEASFYYGYYQEGDRNLFGLPNPYKPIRVDTINSTGLFNLTDRVKLGVGFIQDTWSGATPVTTATKGFMTDIVTGASGASHVVTGRHLVDEQFNAVKATYPDGTNLTYVPIAGGSQPVHMLSSASPETRKQGDAHVSYEWDEASLTVGGGVSSERDYDSHFINAAGSMDFNQKLTTLTAGMSFTDSDVNSDRVIGSEPYVDYSEHFDQSTGKVTGNRKDWSGSLGFTQVINKKSLLSGGLTYTRSTGYLSNPYKIVTFLFKNPTPLPGFTNTYEAELVNSLENRPSERNQFSWDLRYVQYVDPLDAALHLDYRLAHDDWGILAHTFAASWDQPLGDGWMLTPKVRYYTQDAADFYKPFFTFNQTEPVNDSGIDYSKLAIKNFSSDHRLSGYGALSGGISLSKTFAKGVSFETSFEYYTHSGRLKLGSGGENRYADFDYYLVNAGVNVNLSALSSSSSSDSHHHHHIGHGSAAPAGVMYEHILHSAGDVMVGYRYMYGRQAGDMLRGTTPVSDQTVANQACASNGCDFAPGYMNMHMHMLELMYAPTDWLTLMLMPQFVDMNMSLRPVDGQNEVFNHATGGVGDIGFYTMFKLFDMSNHHFHATVGISAPTGDSGIELTPGGHNHGGDDESGGYIHYGMQLGSGTWDIKPSLTYTGEFDQWLWGAQVNSTVRLQSSNPSGYALGDTVQTTAWGGYQLFDWLSATVRGVYTMQGAIRGEFNGPHPIDSSVDYASNYGGRYWDVGFGISATIPDGSLAGNKFAFEWLQPVYDDVNGYQLEREGALTATWGLVF